MAEVRDLPRWEGYPEGSIKIDKENGNLMVDLNRFTVISGYLDGVMSSGPPEVFQDREGNLSRQLKLSVRELEILWCRSNGVEYKAIAGGFGISKQTVKNEVTNILDDNSWAGRDMTRVILVANELGILEPIFIETLKRLLGGRYRTEVGLGGKDNP